MTHNKRWTRHLTALYKWRGDAKSQRISLRTQIGCPSSPSRYTAFAIFGRYSMVVKFKISIVSMFLLTLGSSSVVSAEPEQGVPSNYKFDVLGFGCVEGFGGWTEPAAKPEKERACDQENIASFKKFLGDCGIPVKFDPSSD